MNKNKSKMIEFKMYSVSKNSDELIKELKDIIWKLEYDTIDLTNNTYRGPKPPKQSKIGLNEGWLKINYGCRSIKISPITIDNNVTACIEMYDEHKITN